VRRPHLLDGEAVRDHQRLGTVVAGGGQQLERAAAAVGLGAVATAAGRVACQFRCHVDPEE